MPPFARRPTSSSALSELLECVKAARLTSKSGLTMGLGEADDRGRALLERLRGVRVDIVTIGQNMRPSLALPEAERYVHPAVFAECAGYGRGPGIPHVFSEPKVRSSYDVAQFA